MTDFINSAICPTVNSQEDLLSKSGYMYFPLFTTLSKKQFLQEFSIGNVTTILVDY